MRLTRWLHSGIRRAERDLKKREAFILFPLMMIWSLYLIRSTASAAEIQNVVVEQSGQDRIIHYDLVGQELAADIELTVVVQGKSYSRRDLHLSGDMGTVKLGRKRSISWSILRDFPDGTRGPVETRLSVAWAVSRDRKTDMEFVAMKAGCYLVGDLVGDGTVNKKPVHEVCVSDFAIGRYEV